MAEVIKTIVDVDINTGKYSSKIKQLQQETNAFFLSLNKNNKAAAAATKAFSDDLMQMVNSSRVFTAEQMKMRTAAGALDDTLRKGQATLGQYFSAKYAKNSAMFAETLDLARNKATLLQTQFVATGAAAKGFQEVLAIKPLNAFANEATIASQKTQILSQMFRQGTTQLVNFGKNVQWAGRQLMVGFTIPLTIFGTTASRIFRDLEKEAVNFRKVYGDIFTSDMEIEQNLEQVKELSKEFTKYGIAVKDTMELAAIAAQAGKQGAELQAATVQATRLATLGDLDRQEAMRTTIALQSAFKMSNEDLANSINFLNMVENSSVLSLQDLSDAIPRVAPVIVGLGGDVKDMAVFLAAMREGGVNAAEAANGLKSSLGRLITPTKQAKEMAADFGISLEQIVQRNRGDILKTVMDLATAMKSLDQLDQQKLLSTIFGKFQYARIGALFENITREGSQAQRIIEMMDMSIEDMAASAQKELGAIEESIGTKLTATIERIKLEIAPIGELFVKISLPVLEFLSKILERFNELSDGKKQFIAIAAVITGVVIPVGTMLLGLFFNLTGQILKLTQFVGAFAKGFAKGGILNAIKNATQSTRFLSNAEMEAALAAQQLGTATDFTNQALRKQAVEAYRTSGAINYLSQSLNILLGKMRAASAAAPFTLGAAGAASRAAGMKPQSRNMGGKILKLNEGNIVPGTGNTDTVPALLTPGEFVVNKKSTRENLGLLNAINSGQVQGFNDGGTPVQNVAQTQKDLDIITGKDSAPKPKQQPKNTTSQTSRAKSSTGTTFAHMQPNVNIGPKDFELMYKNLGQRGVAPLTVRQQALWEIGKQTGFAGWRGVGNLGFDIDREINKLLNASGGTGNVSPKRLIDDLTKRQGTAYRGMLSSIGVPQKDIPNVSKELHRQVIGELKKFPKDKMLKDADLYKVMPKTVEDVIKRQGFGKLIPNLDKIRELRTGPVVPGRYGEWTVTKAPDGQLVASRKVNGKTESVKIQAQGAKEGMQRRATQMAKANPQMSPIAKKFTRVRRNKGGKIFKLNDGNMVPGVGSSDKVPALLTPGEFVVNKEASKNNMGLLTAINDGSVQRLQNGGPAGDAQKMMKEFGKQGSRTTAAQVTTALSQGYTPGDVRSGALTIDQLNQMNAPTTKRSMTSRVAGGLSAASMGLLFAPMIAEPMQNSSNDFVKTIGDFVAKMSPVLMGIGLLGPMLPGIVGALGAMAGPVVLIAGVAGLVATAMVKHRQSIDEAAKQSAKLGASSGGVANALDTMAAVLGKQTPLQMQLNKSIKFTDAQLEQQQETLAALQTEQGQLFVEQFKGMSSEQRIAELTSYLQNAIAGGLMDRSSATEFARVMATTLSDSLLGPSVMRQIASQQTGSSAMLELAQRRGEATREQREVTTVMTRGGAVQQGAAGALEDATFNIGNAIQVYKDASQAQAMARIELQNGIITQKQFNETLEQTVALQKQASEALKSALQSGADAGALAQAFSDQFILAGGDEKVLKIIEKNLNSIDELLQESGLSGEKSSLIKADLQLKLISGELNPQDLPILLETIKENPQAYVDLVINGSVNGTDADKALLYAWAQKALEGKQQETFGIILDTDVELAKDAQAIIAETKGTDVGDILQSSIAAESRQGRRGQNFVDEKAIREIIAAYKELDTLPKSIDKELVFNTAVVDGKIDPEKLRAKIEELNTAYDNLLSSDPKIVKEAEITIAQFYGGDAGTIEQLRKEFEDFNNLTLEDKTALIKIQSEIDSVGLELAALSQAMMDPNISMSNAIDIANRIAALRGRQAELTSQKQNYKFDEDKKDEGGSKELSNLEKFRESYKATMTEAKQFYDAIKVGKKGLDLESAALLYQNGLLDVNAKERKKVVNEIKRQQSVQAALAYLSKSSQEREIERLQGEISSINRSVMQEENRLRNIQRQTEMDQRQVGIRQRALELLSRREEQINKSYDKRIEVLDKVAKLNDRLARQNQDRISLASALTSGDIAAAAQAANQMQASAAQDSMQDTRDALQLQRERELASLQVSVNGVLMSRVEIERQITEFNDRIYDRSLQMLPIQDSIYNKQEQIRVVNEQIDGLQDQIKQKEMAMVQEGLKIIESFGKKSKKAKMFKDEIRGAYNNAVDLHNKLGQPVNKVVTITTRGDGAGPAGNRAFGGLIGKFAMGGKVGKYAYGGRVSYKGSTESPPRMLRMAMGSVVPGLGNTDRVPAMLTPGEFVVRKSVASRNMPLLEALNSDVFPDFAVSSSQVDPGSMPSSTIVSNTPVYNTYSVNVNVPGATSSPEEIANVVASKLRRMSSTGIRGMGNNG